jgi:dTDP-glucose 4,6-dehydratase
MIKDLIIKNVLVTGGSGFIGSHFLSKCCINFPNINFVNLDNLSYAASMKTQEHLQSFNNYSFYKTDITDLTSLQKVFDTLEFDLVVHFAAESHVDNSISSPIEFINSNIIGTYNLLQCLVSIQDNGFHPLFHHISTDEVYGSLDSAESSFTETSLFAPSSPYSASKASSDLLVEAWGTTYNLRYLITNCSNNFGPRQYLEKLIPKVILNRKDNKKIPVYGSGKNIRDWLYVEDHIDAILSLYDHGLFANERFNIGGGHEVSNIEIIESILEILDEDHGFSESHNCLEYVADRKGHDFRYSIDSSKIKAATGWSPQKTFREQLSNTVNWYIKNSNWWDI